MNDQSQIMNQPPIMMSQGQILNQPPPPPQVMMNQPPPQLLNPPPQGGGGSGVVVNQSQFDLIGQSQPLIGQSQMMSQSQVPPPIMSRSYMPWKQQQQNPNLEYSNKKFHGPMKPGFGNNPKQSKQMQPMGGGRSNNNWKGKRPNDNRKDQRKVQKLMVNSLGNEGSSVGGYKPPTLHELQSQNRIKARNFYPKKKFNNRFAPYAPRNTSSFIIRAKKSGGIASLVSPCPVTPAVLPTPIFSPSREVLGDMAKEEWGVDGYGSMKGLIRLRNEVDSREIEEDEDENDEENNGSSESDVEEEKNSVLSRLDHEMSRFEMVYPNYGVDYNNVLENRVDDQDTHIAQLEEENLTLRERLFLMEREMEELRRRLQFLEGQNRVAQDAHEEVVENVSENDSDERSDTRGMGDGSKDDVMDYVEGHLADRHGVDNDALVKEQKDELPIVNKSIDDVALERLTLKAGIEEGDTLAVKEGKGESVSDEAGVEKDEVKDEKTQLETLGCDEVKDERADEDAGNMHLEKSIGDRDQ